ncbi:MAG: Na/Pi cotransporter family protein, partial [Chloroflexota bacterium]|nr:Na/Pi cotransporter family protein [Chloroflexota bacterium]
MLGIKMLSEGLEKLAGTRLQEMLEKLTDNPLKGAFFGAFATALIQSSSLLMVTMIGLINAGLMTLEQAVGVILGQEIGTSLTGQLAAFKVGDLCFLIITLGFIMRNLLKSSKGRNVGGAVLGVGILFLGMKAMSSGVSPLKDTPFFTNLVLSFSENPVFSIAIGAIFTAMLQSSSAMTGLVIAMGMNNAIDLTSAIGLIFGANIGTCVDTQLVSLIGSSLSSKRAALSQIIINVAGVLIFLPFLLPFSKMMASTSSSLPRQIANAHTVFNVISSLIAFPFVGKIVATVKRIIPGEERRVERKVKFLDERILTMPSIAISEASKEVNRLAEIVNEMVKWAEKALMGDDERAARLVIEEEDEVVDYLCNAIERFVDVIMDRDLSEKELQKCVQFSHNVTDIERVADLANNLAEACQEKLRENISFSPQAQKELGLLFEKVKQAYDLSIKSLKTDDRKLAQKVL